MLVILLTVLVQDNSHCVLFMDEPEASLHIEWQQKLIAMIRELNPNVQIIDYPFACRHYGRLVGCRDRSK